VGETTNPKKSPAEPMVTAEWPVEIPPTVMLFAAIVPAGIPCASTNRDEGAVPTKLNVVLPVGES